MSLLLGKKVGKLIYFMKQIDTLLKETKNKKLLVIFPHPDDETMVAGGLLLHAKKMGFQTTAIILTKGGAGQLHIHPKGKTAKQVRTAELEKAGGILQLNKLIILDYDDGKLRIQKDEWIVDTEKYIKEIKPGIVVTFDHSGWTGHPDHIISSIEIKKVIEEKFPKIILLWRVIPDIFRDKWMNGDVVDMMVDPDYVLELKNLWIKKWLAARAYKSQRFGQTRIKPLIRIVSQSKHEWYHKVGLGKVYKHKFVKFDI
jgi:hypothetical protein